ncbi:MAG: response regulator transcription factor [Planctomycetales bacterium]|nr:response regulator transcription factor [Planctomycetales bacterium]
MKIALVEQDELLADLVSFRLELLGHEVTIYSAASPMLAALGTTAVDLLIVDTYLPDMQGWEAIQKVRHLHSAEQLPILVLSLDTDLSLVEQAYKAGANEYLITPFDPATLQEKTDALLLKQHCHSR